MSPFVTNIRGYGWYCTKCKERKPILKVWVAKVKKQGKDKEWIGVVCKTCNTILSDCFIAKQYYTELKKQCLTCEDRFQCFTMSEAEIARPLINAYSHEIRSSIPLHTEEQIGIQSYTGKIYDKLEPDEFCDYPERDDCNHSYMRNNYIGEPYWRCKEMKYDSKNKTWYCRFGKILRG